MEPMSPMQTYFAGGATTISDRTAQILMAAEQSHYRQRRTNRQAEAVKPVPFEAAPSSGLTPAGAAAIGMALSGDEANRRRWAKESEKSEREHQALAEQRTELLSHCRPATVAEYAEWLVGYLNAGGRVTSVNSGPMRGMWWMLTPPTYAPKLCGALSVDVIVPDGFRLARSLDWGHSTFYLMDRFELVGHSVPLPSDVRALLEK